MRQLLLCGITALPNLVWLKKLFSLPVSEKLKYFNADELIEGTTHYHQERNHQGKGNELLMPLASQEALGSQLIRSQERLGGLLKFYNREAA